MRRAFGEVAALVARRLYRWRAWERHATSPAELLGLFTNPAFVLSSRFAQLLVMVSTTMMCASAQRRPACLRSWKHAIFLYA